MYSNRGIPYRRGYLFHGGPGVGKTSLSFALAGLFGLEIYCLSLSEITLTEEDLIMLFTALPQRCIVLLEDIDCAGVSRPEPAGKDKKRQEEIEEEEQVKNGGVCTSPCEADERHYHLRPSQRHRRCSHCRRPNPDHDNQLPQ